MSISLQAANSVTHNGVTVHFTPDRTIGYWANGEPYISGGSITVSGIDKPNFPEGSGGAVGGAMINPLVGETRQGFCPRDTWDATAHYYDQRLDVSLRYPFNVTEGESLVVARAIGEGHEDEGGAYSAYIDSIVGFLVLPTDPPAGSFRPSLYGKNHAVRYNMSEIDWSVLKNLPPVPATPSQAFMEHPARQPKLPWWEWTKEWTGTFIRPLENCGTGNGAAYRSQYGREVAQKWGVVALWLNTANTKKVKEKTMVYTIQAGLDLIGYFENGGTLIASGGHQVGRKFPVLLAAAALKKEELVKYASSPGWVVEDLCTFYVKESDVGRTVEGGQVASYMQADVGQPEWGIDHSWNPFKDDRRWEDGIPYRFVQWPAMSGQIIAAEIMGLKSLWGHPAIFDYNAKFIAKRGLIPNSFEDQMLKRYGKNLNITSSPQGVKITK